MFLEKQNKIPFLKVREAAFVLHETQENGLFSAAQEREFRLVSMELILAHLGGGRGHHFLEHQKSAEELCQQTEIEKKKGLCEATPSVVCTVD